MARKIQFSAGLHPDEQSHDDFYGQFKAKENATDEQIESRIKELTYKAMPDWAGLHLYISWSEQSCTR